jgi:hypothetical protein
MRTYFPNRPMRTSLPFRCQIPSYKFSSSSHLATMKVSFSIVPLLAAVDAFTLPSVNRASIVSQSNGFVRIVRFSHSTDDNQNDSFELEPPSVGIAKPFNPLPPLTAASIIFSSNAAFADSPDWGLFEGRTGSILHPIMMIGMLVLSISTALLGFDWRRQVRSLSVFSHKCPSALYHIRLMSHFYLLH